MSKRTYKNRPAKKKAELLKRHYVDKVPVSELCNAEGLQPSVFYA